MSDFLHAQVRKMRNYYELLMVQWFSTITSLHKTNVVQRLSVCFDKFPIYQCYDGREARVPGRADATGECHKDKVGLAAEWRSVRLVKNCATNSTNISMVSYGIVEYQWISYYIHIYIYSGWWFGTCLFSIIYGMSSFQLTFIFFKTVKTTNQY